MPPLNILIVDDDPSLVNAARALLSRSDCHIEAVFSGLDAISRVRAGGIEAVLMDVWMPEVNGLSALEEIARLPHPPRVVMMTGAPDARVERAVEAGLAIACLSKPVDFHLALALLEGKAPKRPLQLAPALNGTELAALATGALARGTVFLESAPQLPNGSPLSLLLETPAGELPLLGAADPSARPAGRRGLGVRLVELTKTQQHALRTLSAAQPEPAPAPAPAVEPSADRAMELFHRGLEKLEDGKYEKALLDLRAALELQPSHLLLAAAAARAEELAGGDKARQLYQRAIAAAPIDAKEALRQLEDAIRLDRSCATYHREAARFYQEAGNLEQAETCLAAAVHLAPSDPEPRIHLAQLLARAGRNREALWACETALHLFPGDRDLQKLKSRLERTLQPTRPAPG